MLFKAAIRGWLLTGTFSAALAASIDRRQDADVESQVDPCTVISHKQWVSPKEVRACFTARATQVGPTTEKVRDNVLDVLGKTLEQYHAGYYYLKNAPPTFPGDDRVDLDAEFRRIKRSSYKNEFDLHVDVSRTIKKLNDGNVLYINKCYDAMFISYIPTPLVLVTDSRGQQNVHIAPQAFELASRAFPEQIDVWQNALPGKLRGKLASLNGAKVLSIDGRNPFDVADDNARQTGVYQGFGTRQTSFFSSYGAPYGEHTDSFAFNFGDFATKALPVSDSVTLTIQRVDSNSHETITLPFRSRREITTWAEWTNSKEYRNMFCVPQSDTNGVDWYAPTIPANITSGNSIANFQQHHGISSTNKKLPPLNVVSDTQPLPNFAMPNASLARPRTKVTNLFSYYNGVSSWVLDDGRTKTGVLGLSSFAWGSFEELAGSILYGIDLIAADPSSRLIIDLSNNGGGLTCMDQWFARVLFGSRINKIKPSISNNIIRAPPMAQKIVKGISEEGIDIWGYFPYGGQRFAWPNGTWMTKETNWLKKTEKRYIDGQAVEFSTKVADQCIPWGEKFYENDWDFRPLGFFEPKQIAILTNGRCAGVCATFAAYMAKQEGVKTVVAGGKKGIPQQYASSVGGTRTTDYFTISGAIISTKHGKERDALPDFLTNSAITLNLGLSMGQRNRNEPEEWQSRDPNYVIPLTLETVNNPFAIWEQVAKTVW